MRGRRISITDVALNVLFARIAPVSGLASAVVFCGYGRPCGRAGEGNHAARSKATVSQVRPLHNSTAAD